MDNSDNLLIHFDFRSRTALIELGGRSLVLPERFDNREAAEDAAEHYARKNWGYMPNYPKIKH
jgi:hypothetical protein